MPQNEYMYEDRDLTRLDLLKLVAHCVREREQYRRTQQHDTRFSFELFRRAIVEGNQDAWEQIYHMHRNLVEYWVRRCSAFDRSEETSESCTLAAFARFARVVRPDRFADFPTLAALLHYLRRCAESVVFDSVRAQRPADTLPDKTLLSETGSLPAADDLSSERIERQEFWHTVMGLLHTEAERVVVLRSFILNQRPSDIYKERPDLFANIADVYSIKRNVIVRLRRNVQIEQLLEVEGLSPTHTISVSAPSPVTTPLQQAAAFAFERMLRREPAVGIPSAAVSPQVRRACGRWIALRRMDLGITNSAITAQLGMNAQTLLMIEAGRADAVLINRQTKTGLIALLDGDQATHNQVADVVALALGQDVQDMRTVLALLQNRFAPVAKESMRTTQATKQEVEANDRAEEHQEFWDIIADILPDERERVVIRTAFGETISPHEIFKQHPNLFRSVQEISAIKKDFISGFNRNLQTGNLIT